MNTEQNQKVLLEQLEALKKENEQLKKELSILRNENISNRPVSFKEKYAVRILDSLPDMLTVFNQNEVGIEVVSNEETNHVGISNKDFKGMYMREMVPPEAYQIFTPICVRLSARELFQPPIMNWILMVNIIITKIVSFRWMKSMY